MRNKKYIGIFVCAFAFYCVLPAVTITNKVKLLQGGTIEFEGGTNDNFETTLSAIDPFSDNLVLLQAGSGIVAFLSDINGCAAIGPGTGGFLPLWLGGACSTSIGDSVIRELAGNILFDDGVNDILTFDFMTNPTGAITWTIGDVSGVPLIDSGIAENEIIIGTATNGEAVGGDWEVVSGNLKALSTGRFVQAGFFSGDDPGSFIDGRNASRWDFRIGNVTKFTVAAGSGFTVNLTGAEIFALVSGTTNPQMVFNRSGVYQGRIKTDNITADRSWQLADIDGTFVMSSESPGTNLTADDQVVTMTDGIMLISSNSGVAADRTFTLDISSMVVDMPYSLRWIGANSGELLNTGVYFLSAIYSPDTNDIITVYTDATNVYEISRSVNRN